MKAHEIMSTPVVCVAPDDAVKAAARTMVLHRVSGLPVIDAEQKLVGIISESDLMHRAELETDVRPKWWLVSFGDTDKYARAFAKSHGTLVRDVMSGAVICVQAEAPLAEVARVLDDNKIKRVPVLDHARIVGMITRGDLVRAFAQTPTVVPVADHDSARLTSRIAKTMREQTWLDAHLISVYANNGRVTLRGFIPTHDQRSALTVLIRGTEGVTEIEDHLLVGRPTLSAV